MHGISLLGLALFVNKTTQTRALVSVEIMRSCSGVEDPSMTTKDNINDYDGRVTRFQPSGPKMLSAMGPNIAFSVSNVARALEKEYHFGVTMELLFSFKTKRDQSILTCPHKVHGHLSLKDDDNDDDST